MQPKEVTRIDMVFGRIDGLLPPMSEIPAEFRMYNRSPWTTLVGDWFYSGISADIVTAKPGIDKWKALAHLKAIMASYEPSHEHKMAGVAYLMSLWFDLAPDTNEGKPKPQPQSQVQGTALVIN